jgi:cytochrome c peroxidase
MLEKTWRIVLYSVAATAIALTAFSARAFEPFQPLPASPPIPTDNPQTQAKVALGKMLFFDRRLSVNGSLSCNSCHDLSHAGADFRALPVGATGIQGRRSVPTLWNVAYETVFFLDGRAATLEDAIQSHLLDTTVMAMPSTERVRAALADVQAYRDLFAANFVDGLSYTNISRALASYIRSLRTPGSAFDHYLRGNSHALSAQARRGFRDFIETGCASCHFWVNLSGPVPGLAFQQGEGFYELFPNFPGTAEEKRYHLTDDLGRFNVTHIETDRRMWRVPVLRNVELTAPYFHNGSVATLGEAIRVMAKTQLGVVLDKQAIADIGAFLKSLTGKFPQITVPQLP